MSPKPIHKNENVEPQQLELYQNGVIPLSRNRTSVPLKRVLYISKVPQLNNIDIIYLNHENLVKTEQVAGISIDKIFKDLPAPFFAKPIQTTIVNMARIKPESKSVENHFEIVHNDKRVFAFILSRRYKAQFIEEWNRFNHLLYDVKLEELQ